MPPLLAHTPESSALSTLFLAAPASTRGTLTTPAPARRGYVNPLTGRHDMPLVIREFDPPAQRWLPGHRGVDLAAPVGARIVAPAPGQVRYAGVIAGTPTVSLQHAGGVITSYQPLTATVTRGQWVTQGEVIGILSEPTTAYPGLSWGARIGENYLNPLYLLKPPPIRLKKTNSTSTNPQLLRRRD